MSVNLNIKLQFWAKNSAEKKIMAMHKNIIPLLEEI